MIIESGFKPLWWLSNPHAQTLYPVFVRSLKAPIDKIERVELPDGDFLDLSWAINGLGPETPLVILLHGLGGSHRSKYIAGFMEAFNRRGWRSVLMHFRGASEEPNRLLRAYHYGDTADLSYVLKSLCQREPKTPKAVVGVSLGGNVLLKWLGEQGQQGLIQAAVAVSVPFMMSNVANRMGIGFSKVYQRYLVKRMQDFFKRKQSHLSDNAFEFLKDIGQWKCFWTFDEHVVAPLHGFKHAHDYYLKSSSMPYLRHIATPTLIIHALDDPFMTPDIIPREDQLSKDVLLEVSQRGGHAGFISSNKLGKPVYWLDERIPEFLANIF